MLNIVQRYITGEHGIRIREQLTSVSIVDTIDEETGNTLLHVAAAKGDITTILRLKEFDLIFSKHLNLSNTRGNTPITRALIKKQFEAVDKLIWLGADIFAHGDSGKSAAFYMISIPKYFFFVLDKALDTQGTFRSLISEIITYSETNGDGSISESTSALLDQIRVSIGVELGLIIDDVISHDAHTVIGDAFELPDGL